MNYQVVIYFLIFSLSSKANAYDDSNGLIAILSQNHTRDGLAMNAGTRNHDNYFIILKNHGVEFNADFIFKAEWDPEKGTYHNEDNWSRIKIYKMKKDLPEILNEYHFYEYKEGEPIEYDITSIYPKGQETTNMQYAKIKIYCLDENESYFIQVPLAPYPRRIYYDFEYSPLKYFDEKCMPILEESKGSNLLAAFYFISLIILLIL